jgi:hypothetical protein
MYMRGNQLLDDDTSLVLLGLQELDERSVSHGRQSEPVFVISISVCPAKRRLLYMWRLSDGLKLAQLVLVFTLEAWTVLSEECGEHLRRAEVDDKAKVRLYEYRPQQSDEFWSVDF